MENLPSNALDFKNNELNNNGASSNKGSSSNNSDSCSSGTSSRFSELFRCHLLLQVREKNLGHVLMMNFVKNLHIPIFFQQESLAIRLKGKYKLALVNT